MKTTMITFAIAIIALFGFNTAQAQSLDSYTAIFNSETGELAASGKVGGLGKKKRSVTVTLVANVEVESLCKEWIEQEAGKSGNIMKKLVKVVASTEVTLNDSHLVDGKGFGTFSMADLATQAITDNACAEGQKEFEGSTTKTFVSGYIEINGNITYITL